MPESEFEICRVTDLNDAIRCLKTEDIHCVLVKGRLPGSDDLALMEAIHAVSRSVRVIFYRTDLSALAAVQLYRNGAYECVGIGDSFNALQQALMNACAESRRERSRRMSSGLALLPTTMVGASRAMRDVIETIEMIAPRRCTVLITGETGTGKELAARAIHLASPRGRLPMVAVNCGALPEHLLEAELFGHVKGAFTGAVNNRTGRFEQAHRSTIFLDEIGEMPLELQAKLLRVLQERELQRLGSSETIRIDVRVIAATNVDLQEKVRQGKFRLDLFYRLNVVPLRMPPLRERPGDIPLLVDHFVAKLCAAEDLPVKRVTEEAKEQLKRLHWPGNVRELENRVEMAIAMSGGRDTLSSADLGLRSASSKIACLEARCAPPPVLSNSMNFEESVANFQRAILTAALSETRGNKTAAAELLGMKRTTLIMKLRALEDYAGCLPQTA